MVVGIYERLDNPGNFEQFMAERLDEFEGDQC